MNWRRRIRDGLESILQSAPGYQRIFSVSPLVTVPTTSGSRATNGHGGLLYYRAHLISVGHTSLQAPQDLVQHRLHEGYLPEVGNVDRDISRIELLHASVTGQSIIWLKELLKNAIPHELLTMIDLLVFFHYIFSAQLR